MTKQSPETSFTIYFSLPSEPRGRTWQNREDAIAHAETLLQQMPTGQCEVRGHLAFCGHTIFSWSAFHCKKWDDAQHPSAVALE